MYSLVSECDRNKNKSINPLTGYEISEQSKMRDLFNKLCSDEIKKSKKN